jgi:hypothetical protein
MVTVTAGDFTVPTVGMTRMGGTLEGRVTSSTTSFPLTGALVSLPDTSIETYTGADGRYRLLDIPASGVVDVIFSEVSHSPLFSTTAVVASRVTTLDAALSFGFGLIQGTVRRLGGPPLVGAVVSIPEHRLTTLTGFTGAYRFDRVPADNTVSVGVGAAGHAADSALLVVPPNGFVVQDFALGATTGSIAGSLKETGTLAPIPGGLVTIPSLFLSTTADASGAFSFTDVPAQVHLLRVQATGYSPLATSVEVPPGVTANANLLLVSLSTLGNGTLSGQVKNAVTGAGVPRALISFPTTSRTTFTNAAGNYAISGLQETSSLQLIVNAVGFLDLTTTTPILRDRNNLRDIALTPLP